MTNLSKFPISSFSHQKTYPNLRLSLVPYLVFHFPHRTLWYTDFSRMLNLLFFMKKGRKLVGMRVMNNYILSCYVIVD